MGLKVETMVVQGRLLVRLEGELDVYQVDQVRAVMEQALDDSGSQTLILDLENMSFIDSSGLGVLLGRYKRLQASGGTMLAASIQPQVHTVFELSGLLKLIRIYPALSDALQNA